MIEEERTAKNPLGPTGKRVMANVESIREARRLSYRETSDRLEKLGRVIPTLGLSRIERGTRRVDADDLVALALVLEVTPNRLLLPPSAGDEPVELAPAARVPAWGAWYWADGRQPLPTRDSADDEPFYTVDEYVNFTSLARPADLAARESQPAARAAQELAVRLDRLLAGAPTEKAREVRKRMVRRALERLTAEVSDLLEADDDER